MAAVKKAEAGEEGSIEWFLAQDGGTDEEKEIKRRAWTLMQTGEYQEALRMLWKNFPDEYPIPEKEKERYEAEIFGKTTGKTETESDGASEHADEQKTR